MDCPRCGTPMEHGICPNCGFPVVRIVPYQRMIIILILNKKI